jgi:peptide-methionine (S)-S-oxide reductase
MAAGSVIEGTSLRVLPSDFPDPAVDLPAPAPPTKTAAAVLAGGCFWCTEAVYRQLDGVLDVVPGYAGGTKDTADYETVCTGRTNHAEAIRITYDPSRVTYGQILKVFFSVAHDPTQLNRQGTDVGRLATQRAILQRLGDGWLIDQRATRDIDQKSAALKVAQEAGVNEAARL